jgi:hypothetical protein
MVEPSRSRKTDERAGPSPDRGADKRTPRWVFALGVIIAIALVALIVLLHLSGTLGPRSH